MCPGRLNTPNYTCNDVPDTLLTYKYASTDVSETSLDVSDE